jgi:NAD(P)-dependent dehydrogenase (short-subunit alcohol dehydrogenase family)
MSARDLGIGGRVAVVTGGGRGIGRAIAAELAAAGVAVAVVARSRDQVDRAARAIEERGGVAWPFPADITDADGLPRLLERVILQLGPVGILVNNAAVAGPLGPNASLDPRAVAGALSLNVSALIATTITVLPGMLARGWGRIVNVSSGVVAWPASMIGSTAYVTGKAAVEAHTLNLAAELRGSGITVNAYRPGSVDTSMQEWIRGQDPAAVGGGIEWFRASHDEGQLIPPRQSARALVSQLAGDQTGAIWEVADTMPAQRAST